MTDSQIDAMEAGPELDAEIASEIFGHDVGPWGDEVYAIAGNPNRTAGRGELIGVGSLDGKKTTAYAVPKYSTDIAAAWTVVECLQALVRPSL